MAFWQEVDDKLHVSETFEALDDGQAEAAIAVLVMAIHADRKVRPLEVAGINHVLFDLPGLEPRHELVRGWVAEAARQAEGAADGTELRALADRAASQIRTIELRERIFVMAAALARVDLELAPAESEALTMLARAFGIRPSRAEELLAFAAP